MPLGIVEDEALARILTSGVAQGQQFAVDGIERACLGGAAFLIEAIELPGQLSRAGRVACKQQLDHVVRYVHASGGVDARRDAEANLGRGRRAVQRNLRQLHQRAQAGLHGIGKRGKTQSRNRPVFADERNGVRNRGNGHQLEERGEQYTASARAEGGRVRGERCGGVEQRLRQLECDGGPAQVLVGIGAAGLRGIDNSQRVGNRRAVGRVVVGDDEVERKRARLDRLGNGADSGVNADHQAHAGRSRFAEDCVLHSVSLADAMRQVIGDLHGLLRFDGQPDSLDGRLQQGGRRGAVHVVVAVDQNRLGVANCVQNSLDGGVHAYHLRGVAGGVVEQRFQRGVEKGLGRGRRVDAARDKNLRDGRRAAEMRCQSLVRLGIRVRLQNPRVRLL